jgi:hypothetical protein
LKTIYGTGNPIIRDSNGACRINSVFISPGWRELAVTPVPLMKKKERNFWAHIKIMLYICNRYEIEMPVVVVLVVFTPDHVS